MALSRVSGLPRALAKWDELTASGKWLAGEDAASAAQVAAVVARAGFLAKSIEE